MSLYEFIWNYVYLEPITTFIFALYLFYDTVLKKEKSARETPRTKHSGGILNGHA
jgi:hypothetical protein